MRCPGCGGPGGTFDGECLACLRDAAAVRRGINPTCPVCDSRDCQGHAEPPEADEYQRRMNEAAEHEAAAQGGLEADLRALLETLSRVAALAGELGHAGIARWANATAEDAEGYLKRTGPRGPAIDATDAKGAAPMGKKKATKDGKWFEVTLRVQYRPLVGAATGDAAEGLEEEVMRRIDHFKEENGIQDSSCDSVREAAQ